MTKEKTAALCAELRKIASEIRRTGAENELKRIEKKAACATALLGLELLARRITR